MPDLDPPSAVYVAFEAFPRPKGAGTHMAFTLEALAQVFDSVACLCLGFGVLPAYQREGRIMILRYKGYHPNLLRRAEGFARFVAEHVRVWRPSLRAVVFRDPWGGAPALAEAGDVYSVFELNGLPSWELPYLRPNITRRPALVEKIRALEFACLREASRILTVSPVTARTLEGLGVDTGRLSVLPNSALDVYFRDDAEPPSAELTRGRWIAYVGSAHEWQGVETLVRAFALVADAHPDVRLAIVSGAKRAAWRPVRRLARRLGLEDRMRFLGPLVPRELAGLYRAVQFTAAPLAETDRNTVQGCCPLKVVESMASGTPVLGSDLAALRALVDHGVNGWLAEPEDVRGWALALEGLLRDEDLCRHLGRRARAKAREEFSWDRNAQRFAELFSGVRGGTRR